MTSERRVTGRASAQLEGAGGILGLCWVLALALTGAVAEGNSVHATPEPSLAGPGFRLLITLDNPASTKPIDAWVGIGPDKGMAEETHVRGGFLIDLAGLRMAAPSPSAHHLCFLGLAETAAWTTARVILSLERGPDRSWLIGARLWDDSLASYTLAGPVFLTEAIPTTRRLQRGGGGPGPGSSAVRVGFEWSAATAPGATDGHFRLVRILDAAEELLVERTDLDNATQRLNYLRVGVVNSAHQQPGTFGELFLDDFTLSRVFGPVPTLSR